MIEHYSVFGPEVTRGPRGEPMAEKDSSTDEADQAFRRFAKAGMHVVRSVDPMSGWSGAVGNRGV